MKEYIKTIDPDFLRVLAVRIRNDLKFEDKRDLSVWIEDCDHDRSLVLHISVDGWEKTYTIAPNKEPLSNSLIVGAIEDFNKRWNK